MASEPTGNKNKSAAAGDTAGRTDGLFDDNVDANPPFAAAQIDAALRSVKIRGRRRRLLAVGPLALVMGSGLALVAFTLDLGGNSQVTQIGSDLGSSAALAPETGSEPQGSSVLRDGSSVGDSYSSGPTQMVITPVPTLSAISLGEGLADAELAADQPPIQFDLTKILAPLAQPTPEASSGVTATTPDDAASQSTSTPTPPVSTSAHTAADDTTDAAASDIASDDAASDDAAADSSATELSVETTAADKAAEPGSESTPDSTSTDDPDVSASGTSEHSSTSGDGDDESDTGADPSTATTSTADGDSQTDLEPETSSAVDDPDAAADPDATADGEPAVETTDGEPVAEGESNADAVADDIAADGADGTDASAAAADADAVEGGATATDVRPDEGDGELVVIDANGDIISPDATPTPVPQPVVLGASAQVSGFEITIVISVLDGDGYSIGACGTTVNWGDGNAENSGCDPSCVAVDSSAPASGVDGQLTFTHVYEVRDVQLTPFFTVYTGLECYGDSSTVAFGPLVITDAGIS